MKIGSFYNIRLYPVAAIVASEDVVVMTMGSPVSEPGSTNLVKIHKIGRPE